MDEQLGRNVLEVDRDGLRGHPAAASGGQDCLGVGHGLGQLFGHGGEVGERLLTDRVVRRPAAWSLLPIHCAWSPARSWSA